MGWGVFVANSNSSRSHFYPGLEITCESPPWFPHSIRGPETCVRALLCLSLHGVLPEPRRTRRFSDARDDRALDVHAVKAALDDLEDFEAKVRARALLRSFFRQVLPLLASVPRNPDGPRDQ